MMKDINISLDLKAQKDTVSSDSGLLQQVFLNIIMNAVDVLKESSSDRLDPLNAVSIATYNRGDYIEIEFTDNGPGIDEDKIEHIFDPFYTTKEPGKGTGLGLSVSYMIIDAQGGKIRAESAKDQGTTIIIDLPIYNRQS
jgi:two-component system, NtrC family, sensor kinase